MKVVVILVGIVVAAGAIWLVAGRDDNAEPATNTSNEAELPAAAKTDASASDPQVVVITYTDNGFSPTQVSINVGDSVVFKNEGSGSFQPASDPHPTHTGLNGFDSDGGVAVGQSYTFMFTKSGSWGFHDHLDSNKQGTVVVR